MTRTPWWTIPTLWLPVVCWLISSSIKNGLPPYHLATSLIAGVCFWTLLEYSLHRFLFHMKTTGYWFVSFLTLTCHFSCQNEATSLDSLKISCRGNTIHYLLHGCHHKHPMDGLRLVFPPAATAIVLVPVRMQNTIFVKIIQCF